MLGNDRFLVNVARKGSFAWRLGGARSCATTFFRPVLPALNRWPCTADVVTAESRITRSKFGSGIRGKTKCAGYQNPAWYGFRGEGQ